MTGLRVSLRWLTALTLLLGGVVASAAQENEQPPDDDLPPIEDEELFEDPLPEGEEPLFFDEGVPQEELERIDELLEEDAVLLDTGFIYDARGRRDPFRSLLRVSEAPTDLGPRPDGVPGLDIDEVIVTGIFVTRDGPVAQIQSSGKGKSYLIRAGDELYDGEVLRIDYVRGGEGEVIFRQVEEDPSAPKPFREVVKRLQP